MAIKDWSTTEGGNNSALGITLTEGATPFANMNGAAREIMAQVRLEVASFGTVIAAAATPDIAIEGGAHTVTGTTTITGFQTAPSGLLRVLHFETATPIVAGSALSMTNRTTAKGDVAFMRSLGSGNWKCEHYAGSGAVSAARGYIDGLILANNSGDATNDIDIAAGEATASDKSAVIVLSSALTKQLDASWAVGANAGMRASGAAIANTTYHIFLIRRPDTGVVDIAADTSASGANIAANTNAAYTQKRRIGSIIRSGGSIVGFKQIGDRFALTTQATDRSDTAAVASGLLTLSVPVGIVVFPIMQVSMTAGASVTCTVDLGSAEVGSADFGVARIFSGAGDSNDAVYGNPAPIFATNTSAQIYFAQTNTAGAPSSSALATLGWIDRRGRDD